MTSKLAAYSTQTMEELEKATSNWTVEYVTSSPQILSSLNNLAGKSFNSWQFERLLNNAADLLDRAMDTRSKILTMREKHFNLEQGLKAQLHELEFDQAGFTGDERTPLDGLSYPTAVYAQELAINKIREYYAQQVSKSLLQAQGNPGPNGAPIGSSAHHQIDAALLDTNSNLTVSQTIIETENERLNLRRRRLAFDDKAYRERLDETKIGASLDYTSEIDFLFQSLKRDYLEAAARLLAATRGINTTFGSSLTFKIHTGKFLDAVAEARELSREFIHWLSSVTQHDQSFTICLRLKSLLKDEGWKEVLQGKSLVIIPHATYFGDWVFTRVRGVSAQYFGSTSSHSVSAWVYPPRSVIREYMKPINQSDAAPAFLGRISRIDAAQPMEVCGAVTLVNLAPDGEWEFALDHRAGVGDFQHLTDIELHIACVGIPGRSYLRMIDTEPFISKNNDF